MTDHEISPDEAARALSEVAGRRRQVALLADLFPAWYFPAIGVLTVVFFSWLDVPVSFLTHPVGLAIASLQMVAIWTAKRQRTVTPHWSLLGMRGLLLAAGLAVTIGILGLAAARFVDSRGLPLPNTMTGLVLGVGVAAGGALSRRFLRRILVSRTGGAAR